MKLLLLNLVLFLNSLCISRDLKTPLKSSAVNVILDSKSFLSAKDCTVSWPLKGLSSKDALSAKDCIMPPDIADTADVLNRLYLPILTPFPIPFPLPINPPVVTNVNP